MLKGFLSTCHLSLPHLYSFLIHLSTQATFVSLPRSVRKWKRKSRLSHISWPPPITELKIPAGLPVMTGKHVYLKGVVAPLPPPSALHATTKHCLDSCICDIIVSAFQSIVECFCRVVWAGLFFIIRPSTYLRLEQYSASCPIKITDNYAFLSL